MIWPLLSLILPAAARAGGGIGLCYSGGGITGMAASMCAHHALTQLVPSFSELDVTVSTASGGTLGYLLHQSTLATDDPAPERSANAKLVEYPPPLAANLTLEQMKSHAVAKGHTWWANAVKLGSEMGAEMGRWRRN